MTTFLFRKRFESVIKKMKIAVLAQKEEEASLRAMEGKLNALLSDDKKTELELTAIESMLS